MEHLGKIGLAISVLVIGFGCYLIFSVIPASEIAQSQLELIRAAGGLQEGQTFFDVPGYSEFFETSEKGVTYGQYLLLASILPFLLCVVGSIKKDKMAFVGLVLSLAGFLIGAIYGTHMFS